ncbi:MAG: DUF4139 domain-containing protein [Gammaproteobacteria bacterium]|nr:DUF4139 domain-containing protein [Gammaproteobacteria bacterium]
MNNRNRRASTCCRSGFWMTVVALMAVLQATGLLATDSQDSITIYSSARPGGIPASLYLPSQGAGQYRGAQVPGFAVVRHLRQYDLAKGEQLLRVMDVAASIDPTTVAFRSLSIPDTRVIEQSFEFDLVSMDKLLQRYLGQVVVVEQLRGESIDEFTGKLLGTTGGLMLQDDSGAVVTLNHYQNIRFPSLPEGLISQPTLVWKLDSPAAGSQDIEIAYQTNNMTWWADYNALLSTQDGACRMDWSAWVSLVNQSGASYKQARLKLLAGEVRRAQPPSSAMAKESVAMLRMQTEEGFAEQSFNEYHLYTLGRPIDVPDNATKQVELFPTSRAIPCQKHLLVNGSPGFFGGQQLSDAFIGATDVDVQVHYQFSNDKQSGLHVPLPAGRVRISELNQADGELEFIGEDSIGHTPRDETVRLHTGSAFDIKASRKQTDFNIDSRARELTESWEIEVRNRKSTPETVLINENLFRAANWNITQSNQKFSKLNSNLIQFEIQLPAETVRTVTYSVRYTW